MKKQLTILCLTGCMALGLTGCLSGAQRELAEEREEAGRQLVSEYLTAHYDGGEIRKCTCLITKTEDGEYAQNAVIAEVYAKDTTFQVCAELGGNLCYDTFSKTALTASLTEYVPKLLKANGTPKQCELYYYPTDNVQLSMERNGFAPYGVTDAETLLQDSHMYVDMVLSYQNLETGEIGRWDYPSLDTLQDTANLDVVVLNFMPGYWEEKNWLRDTQFVMTDDDARALLRDEVLANQWTEMKYTIWN